MATKNQNFVKIDGVSDVTTAFVKGNRPTMTREQIEAFEQPNLLNMLPIHESKNGVLFATEDYSTFCLVSGIDDDAPSESSFGYFRGQMMKSLDKAWGYIATSKQSAIGKIQTQKDAGFIVGSVDMNESVKDGEDRELWLSGEELAAFIIMTSTRAKSEDTPQEETYVVTFKMGVKLDAAMCEALKQIFGDSTSHFESLKEWRERRCADREAKKNAKAINEASKLS